MLKIGRERSARQMTALLLFAVSVMGLEARAEPWDRNLRWSLDYAVDGQQVFSGRQGFGSLHTFGLDAHNTFTRNGRNFVTTVVQAYVAKANDLERRPGFLKSANDWKFLPKIITANFHVSGDGRFNILVGHEELPYGLESSIFTSGTIRQLTVGPNLGVKGDWAVGINGEGRRWNYAFTLSRGTGVDYYREGDPWAFTGRVGTVQGQQAYFGQTGVGLSVFTGKVRLPNGRFIERDRLGLDAQWYRGPLGVMTEVSVGNDEGADVFNVFTELNLVSRRERFAAYVQGRWFNKKPNESWEDQTSWAVGARYLASRNLEVSFQYLSEQEVYGPRDEESVLQLQFRYRTLQ